jgi:hypothetical protein
MTPIMYLLLDVTAGGLRGEVLFNDVPVVAISELVPERRSMKLNGWAVNGENHIQIVLQRASAKEPAGTPAHFSVVL